MASPSQPVAETLIFPDSDTLAAHTASLFADIAHRSIAARGRFAVALSGGSTPEKLHRLLAQTPYRETIDWSRIFVFLGDERFVPPEDPRSNFGMAQKTLLDAVPVPANQIFPVDTFLPSAEDAARAYAALLESHLSPEAGSIPIFDLVLLGLGDDGHTASLFPGMPSLTIADQWAVASPPGILPPPVERVTVTFPVLNAARNVVFLIAGSKKADVVRELVEGLPDVSARPASGVRPAAGRLVYLLEAGAAGKLGEKAVTFAAEATS